MRWKRVKKTCLWHVFSVSPDRACEGGFGFFAERKTGVPDGPPCEFKPPAKVVFLLQKTVQQRTVGDSTPFPIFADRFRKPVDFVDKLALSCAK